MIRRQPLAVIATLLCMAIGQQAARGADALFFYDPESGELTLEASATPGAIDITSDAGWIVGTQPSLVKPPFGIFTPEKLFILQSDGLPREVRLGPILPAGLSHAEVASDFCVAGMVVPSGRFERTGLMGPFGVQTLPFLGCEVVLPTPPVPTPPAFQVRFTYDPNDGGISFVTEQPITTLEMKSASSIFTGTAPDFLEEPFDVFVPNKFFTLQLDGLSDTDLGPIATPGLTPEQVAGDLCVDGSFLPAGRLNDIAFVGANGELLPITGCPRPTGRDRFYVAYESETGEMALRFDGREVPQLSTFMIDSTQPHFTGPVPDTLDGPFDEVTVNRIFHMDPEGFGEIELGPVAKTGLPGFATARELCVAGSLLDGGPLPEVRFLSPTGRVLSVCDIAPPTTGGPTPQSARVVIDYFEGTGELSVTALSPLAFIEITTNGSVSFGPLDQAWVDPPLEVAESNRLFILRPEGFDFFDFGEILEPGLTLAQLQQGFTVDGAFTGVDRELGSVVIRLNPVPEPNTALLVILSFCPLIALHRAHRSLPPFTQNR